MEIDAANTAVTTHSAQNMPLLTELEWCLGLVCYKHGAPDGACARWLAAHGLDGGSGWSYSSSTGLKI
jgi:hypothetical protein